MFRTALLHKYAVRYLKCLNCESAQTERPFWLTESYADDRPLTDTGMVTRTIESAIKTDLILSLLSVPERTVGVDFGGSNGLFTRMMRDRGHNFYRNEPFSKNFYVPFHDHGQSEIREATVVTAFDVFEHFAEPHKDLEAVFAYDPDVLVVGTETYTGQTADWWYFDPSQGQHIFFYSSKALNAIARHYGMYLFSSGPGLHVFCRKDPKICSYTDDGLRDLQQLLLDRGKFAQSALQRSMSQLMNYKYATEDRTEILNSGALAKLTTRRQGKRSRLCP